MIPRHVGRLVLILAVGAILTAPWWPTVAVCDGSYELRIRSRQPCDETAPLLPILPVRNSQIQRFREAANDPGLVWVEVPCEGVTTIRSGHSHRVWMGIEYGHGNEHEAILVRRMDRVDVVPLVLRRDQRTVHVAIP